MEVLAAERALWRSRLSYIFAMWAGIGWPGGIIFYPYVAAMFGGAAWFIAYLVTFALAGFGGILLEAGIGAMHRRAYPAALSRMKHGRILELFGWIATSSGLMLYFAWSSPWATVWLGYAGAALTKAWGKIPGAYFWGPFSLGNWWLFAGTILTLGILAVIMYGGLGILARLAMYTRILMVALVPVYAVLAATYLPSSYWQGVAYFFDFKLSSFLSVAMWASAASIVVFHCAAGFGWSAAYASYLPKGGQLTNSTATALWLDMFSYGAYGFFMLSATLGAGVPATASGSIGPAFTALPKVWNLIPFGEVFGFTFYFVAWLAYLTGIICYCEGINASIMDKFGLSRKRSTIILCAIAFPLAIIAAYPYAGADIAYGSFFLRHVFYYWNWCTFWGAAVLIMLFVAAWVGFPDHFETIRKHVNEMGGIQLPKWFNYVWYAGFAVAIFGMIAAVTPALGGFIDLNIFGIPGYVYALGFPIILGLIFWWRK